MTAVQVDHAAEAERLVQAVQSMGLHTFKEQAPSSLAAAQVHALLAVAERLTPPAAPAPAVPLWDAPLYRSAVLLERFAVGGTGAECERFVARVVCGSITKDAAASLAVTALAAAHDAGPAQVKAVKAAIDTLGIDIEDGD